MNRHKNPWTAVRRVAAFSRSTILLCAAFVILALCWPGRAARAESDDVIKCPSPDGRFALRISKPKNTDDASCKVDLIEKKSGEVVVDLENTYESHIGDTILVWSADSRRVAFATRGYKEGETTIYRWNGSVFETIYLPDHLPSPKIHFGKGAGAVKNYGGTTKPLRWLESGELELSVDSTMLSRVNNKTYTGVVVFTVGIDVRGRASVRKVGKTKTTVDE